MKYPISQEGVDAFKELSSNLRQASENVTSQGAKLNGTISGLENDLGGFADKVRAILEEINTYQKNGSEAVNGLSDKLKMKADKISDIIGGGWTT